METWQFRQKQNMPYEAKVEHAKRIAREFYDKVTGDMGANVHVSVGGLDSITLYFFLHKYVDGGIKGISVSSVEDKSIQAIHRRLGIEPLKSIKSKVEVLNEFGFPVISKEKAGKIHTLANPTENNATVRHAIMTGDCGKQGGYRTGTRMKLPQKWLELFGGYENANYGTNYKIPGFKVSNECCAWLKEKPCDLWASPYFCILGAHFLLTRSRTRPR